MERLKSVARPLLGRVRRAALRWRLPSFVAFGEDCDIHRTVVLMPHEGARIVLGDRVRIRRYGELLGPVSIGNDSRMNRDVYIRPNTHIGRFVRIGAFVHIVSDNHEIGTVCTRLGAVFYPEIVIEDGVWIGTGALILGGRHGRRIGRGVVVGAGAVVTRDIPPDTVWAGNPARMIRTLEPLSDGEEPEPRRPSVMLAATSPRRRDR